MSIVVRVTYALCVAVAAIGCAGGPTTVVQVGLPDNYECVTPVYFNGGNTLRLRLDDGVTVLEFKHFEERKFVVLFAKGGGESYIGLRKEDFHDPVDVRKGR